MWQQLQTFIRHMTGSIAVPFAVAASMLVGVAGVAIDYARFSQTQANLQGLADSAAVAAVRGMAVAKMRSNSAQASVESYVRKRAQEFAWQEHKGSIEVHTKINAAGDSVEVTLSESWSPMLAHVVTGHIKTPVVVSSTAKLVGTGKVCIIGLDEEVTRGVHLDDSAAVTGNDCGVFSNSKSASSLSIERDAKLAATLVCSAGGSDVRSLSSVNPSVTSDCPVMADPLIDRVAPPIGPCNWNKRIVDGSGLVTLKPGVYCGGLEIKDDVQVKLEPGIFIIKDGPLILTGSSSMSGKDVGFFLTGHNAKFVLTSDTSVSLEAPVNGDMAGLLFFEDRHNHRTSHKIQSKDARNLLGTIYLPKSELELSAQANVAGASAYTAMIVNTLHVFQSPTIVLNSDFTATNVPVPPGLIGGRIVLTK